MHAEYCIVAARAEKHIMLEKTGFLAENRAFLGAPINHCDGLMATLMILQGSRSIETDTLRSIAALLEW